MDFFYIHPAQVCFRLVILVPKKPHPHSHVDEAILYQFIKTTNKLK